MIQPVSLKDKLDRERMFAIRAPFNFPCRLDNWNEDLFLREEKTSFATYKRDRCQLLLQKTRRMFRKLTKPTQLSHSLQIVKYGDNYQIMAPYIPHEGTVRKVFLSGLVTEKEIDTCQELGHGSLIVGSVDTAPCARNTFRIVGCDMDRTGDPVSYGDDIYLQVVDDSEVPLYIQCENNFMDIGFHLIPRLSKYTNTYCRFKILSFDPSTRLEFEGCYIGANDKVVIQHVPTGRNLAVENSMMITFFGNEYVISCHTYRDTHRMETAENIWKIIGEDLPNINAVVRAAKGEVVPDEMLG